MIIKILGSGCKYCTELAKNVEIALADSGVTAEIEKVTDFAKIAEYGVMQTPALVANEKVVSFGKVLKPKDIRKVLNI